MAKLEEEERVSEDRKRIVFLNGLFCNVCDR